MAGVEKLMPTGTCWCGCGKATEIGSFFRPGHDKKADAHVIEMRYGSVADFLVHHGFGGRQGDLNLDKAYSAWARARDALAQREGRSTDA